MLNNKLGKHFDFNKIKSDFYNYLIEKGDKTSAEEIISSDISIFSHASDFKDFIQKNSNNYNLPVGFNGNITDLSKINYDEENQEFAVKESDNDSDSIFSGLLNNLIKDENIKNKYNEDGDDKLSQNEINKFLEDLKAFDENKDNLSLDDIFGIFEGIEGIDDISSEQNITSTPVGESEPTNSSSSSSPSTYNPNNYTNTTDDSSNQQKTLDNMSKEELKTELSNANNEYSDNQSKLNSLLDGSDSTLKSMQEDIDGYLKEYQEQLKLVDVELEKKVTKLESNITSKENEINKKDVEISNKNNDIKCAERELSSATSNRQCLEQSLSSLKSTDTSNMSAEKKQEIANKIADLENNKIPEAKQKETEAQNKLSSEKQALTILEGEKTAINKELDSLNTQKKTLDDEITQKYPQISESQNKYNQAKTDYNNYKTNEVSKAQSAVNDSQKRITEVQTAIDKVDNNETENQYKASGLQSTYNLNGTEFDVVGMNGFNNLQEFQQFILSKGMTNRGLGGNDWPMQCHNFSNEYGDIMLGTSKIDINSPDAARQATKGRDRQFQNVYCDSKEIALSVIANELDAGRPVVAKIRTPGKDMNHYGLICGIRKGADRNNLKESDFLYIDSYAGNIGYLGKTRELTGWKNSVHVWQGKDYNFEYKYQNSSARKYMTAAEVRQAYGLA